MTAEAKTITEDIRRAARSALFDAIRDKRVGMTIKMTMAGLSEEAFVDAIATAIHDAVMAERERCAGIADDEAAGRDWQRADANAHNDKRAARDFESMKIEAVQIASAIRATPKAGG